MDNWFKNKWFVRGFALFLAILLYVFVGIESRSTLSQSEDGFIPSSIDMQTLDDIPVTINIDRDRFVVSGVPEEVKVSLEGTKSILTRTVLQRNIEVFVDLTELGEGRHVVDLEYDKVPNDLKVYIDPKTIPIEIEERATDEFSVSVDFINQDKLPEGYEIGESSVNPNKVMIMSSRSVIDKIAIVKVYVDVDGLSESINNREIPVNVYDVLGNVLSAKVEPSSVVVSVEVNKPSKSIPLELSTIKKLPEGYELKNMSAAMEEIELFATTDVLSTISTIKTEDIDLSEINESGEIKIKLDLPEKATSEEEYITVNIELERTRIIKELPIESINLGDNDISFQEPNPALTELTIVGEEKKVSKLTKEDFKLSVDVSGLTEGVHEVPLQIEGPDDLEIEPIIEKVTIIII